MLKCIMIGIGGFIGTICRYLIGLIPVKSDSVFPIKTLVINVVGAFVIGAITAFAAKNESINSNVIAMLKVGLCGGFTTFSTFAFETSDLMQRGDGVIAAIYVTLSIVSGVAAVMLSQNIIR